MRIQGTSAAPAPAASPTARRSASGTFSLEGESRRAPRRATAGTRNIGGIDALLALQGVEEPGERRRKAVKRGRSALDALDALKLGLLVRNARYRRAGAAQVRRGAAWPSRPAIPGSTPCWPRSSCGSRWNSPRSACRSAGRQDAA